MFDGNFRSTREVNLSGRNRRRRQRGGSNNNNNNNNKQTILKNAEIQRKARQEQQRREKSARLIQRITRGHQQRLYVIQKLTTTVLPDLYINGDSNRGRNVNEEEMIAARAVSLLLSKQLQPLLLLKTKFSFASTTTPKQLLLEYADNIIDIAEAENITTKEETSASSCSTVTTNNTTIWCTYRRLVLESLKVLRPNNTDEMERTSLLLTVRAYLPRLYIWNDIPLFLELAVCLQEWYHHNNSQQQQQQQQHDITKQLYQWSIDAVTKMETTTTTTTTSHLATNTSMTNQNLSKALLASILLSAPTSSTTKDNNTVVGGFAATSAWFLPLAEILQVDANNNNNNNNNGEKEDVIVAAKKKKTEDGNQNNDYYSSSNNSNNNNSVLLLVQAIRNNLQRNGNDQKILSNMLDNIQGKTAAASVTATAADTDDGYDPRPIIQLVHYVLLSKNNDTTTTSSSTSTGGKKNNCSNSNDLSSLVALMARGEDNFLLDNKQQQQDASSAGGWGDEDNNNMDDDDDDDDDADDTMDDTQQQQQQQATSSNNNTKKARRSSYNTTHNQRRYTRKELLTSLKLDKIYQDEIQQSKKDLIAKFGGSSSSSKSVSVVATIEALAKKIVHRAPWLKWGLYILDDDNDDDDDDDNNNDSMMEVVSASSSSATTKQQQQQQQQSYIEILACLVQGMTSLRPKAKLNVLSSMAFSKSFMEKLWAYYKKTKSLLALSIFCDLFAHYLIALSDVEFVQYHTTTKTTTTTVNDGTTSSTTKTSIIAQDIIVQLQGVLYELYWSRPVMASEINPSSERGRAFLSGTKVWNSLYDRWNRLLRRPFCDESVWWFPHLASRDGDRAVFPNSQQQQQQEGQDDNVDDDDDDSSDDDSMDVDDDDANIGSAGGGEISAADAETDALADTFQDPKMARILTCIPQALPFDRRVKLFNSLLKADKRKALNAAISNRALARMTRQEEDDMVDMFFGNIREQVQIRRAALYQDSMEQLNSMGSRLKHQIQVSFINQHGAEEAGIDGGGVFKEFLDDLIKDGFAVKSKNNNNNNMDESSSEDSGGGAPPLFAVTPLQTLAVNFDYIQDGMLGHYEFVGRVLGKAVYESILVEPQFCLPFLNQLLAKPNSVEDLKNYDEEYYQNLMKLRQLNESEIESTGLTFELTLSSGSASSKTRPRTVELIPGGRSVAVTKRNVFQYIHMIAHQLLNVQGARQTKAFLRGFRDLVPASWVRLFSANELQKLISGDDSVRGIDVQSLKKSMDYLGGYHISQPYIQEFWDILEKEFTPEQQRKFLRFMTSCSRQPLLGFASLDPAPSIQQIRLGEDEELSKNSRLPTSQTCMNLLKLPNYKNRQLLKEKLLAAIESGAGFELT